MGPAVTGMRAVRMHGYGGPEVLAVDEVPGPRPPRGDEVLVRVCAASVNGTDLGLRRGGLPVATWGRLPFTLGFDLVGEVVARGPRATAFRPGDRVAALLGHGGGAQADLVVLRQHRAARVPDAVADHAAACVPLAGLTALQALVGVAGLAVRPPGSRVLVIGASGGIGAFAVQLAALAGAHVTGVASGPKLDAVRSWGAAEVVDRHLVDVARLQGRWDVVLDAHGGRRFAEVRGLLRPGGTLVSTRPVSPDAWRAVSGVARRRVAPASYGAVMTSPRSQDLAHLLHLVAVGDLTAPLDTVVPVEQAAAAHARAGSDAAGKVVLRF